MNDKFILKITTTKTCVICLICFNLSFYSMLRHCSFLIYLTCTEFFHCALA